MLYVGVQDREQKLVYSTIPLGILLPVDDLQSPSYRQALPGVGLVRRGGGV